MSVSSSKDENSAAFCVIMQDRASSGNMDLKIRGSERIVGVQVSLRAPMAEGSPVWAKLTRRSSLSRFFRSLAGDVLECPDRLHRED